MINKVCVLNIQVITLMAQNLCNHLKTRGPVQKLHHMANGGFGRLREMLFQPLNHKQHQDFPGQLRPIF